MFIDFKFVSIVPIESFPGAKPHEVFMILYYGCDIAVR